eukprot:1686157-Amphidinium_carterae.3
MRSMGISSGSKLQSPRMNIIPLPKAATALESSLPNCKAPGSTLGLAQYQWYSHGKPGPTSAINSEVGTTRMTGLAYPVYY